MACLQCHPIDDAGAETKNPVRFPARAQFVSFNFVNNLICGIVSSNRDAGWIGLNVRRRARPGDLDKVSTVHA